MSKSESRTEQVFLHLVIGHWSLVIGFAVWSFGHSLVIRASTFGFLAFGHSFVIPASSFVIIHHYVFHIGCETTAEMGRKIIKGSQAASEGVRRWPLLPSAW